MSKIKLGDIVAANPASTLPEDAAGYHMMDYLLAVEATGVVLMVDRDDTMVAWSEDIDVSATDGDNGDGSFNVVAYKMAACLLVRA